MLQTYKSPPVEIDEGMPAQDSSLADLFSTARGFVRRHFLVILSLVPLAIGLAGVYLFVTPPLYKGVASILIDPQKLQVFKQSILQTPADLAMMDTQIEILKSDNFALSIINKLDLTHDPEFVDSDGLISDTLRLLHMPRLLRPNEMESESDRKLSALNTFAKRLTATRVGASFVIEVGFLSTDRDRAAEIANAVADAFSVDQLEAKYQTIGRATVWLQGRLNELHDQVAAAERAVVEYKAKNHIVDTGGRLINEQQLSELNTAVVKARADRAEAQARLDRVMQVVNRGDIDPAAAEIATVADALRSEVINKLRGQYLELAQREALFLNRLGPDHLAVVNIRNQKREIRRSIFDELKRIAEGSKSEYDIAKARQSSLEESLAAAVAGSQTTNKAQIELRQLESAAQSYRSVYDNLQQRYTDSMQEQSFPATEARVITRATPPSQKSSPKSALILVLATAGGLAAGFGLALLREISDRVFRTSKQVEARLNAQCLAIVPTTTVATKPVPKVTKAAANSVTTRIITPDAGSGLLWHVVDTPLSAFAESIRGVKVSADSSVAKSNKILGITSSVPNEGKSTIAASLAQLSAHSGARVILVDCDLRKPSLSRQLAPNARAGLLDVVTDMVTIEEAIWSDPSSSLSFLPAGVKSRLFHTNEILASDGMRLFFSRLRECYDYVIVDLSPIIPVVDVRATVDFVDAYVFVAEWGKTKVDVAEHALSSAHAVHDKLVGVVLNKVDLKRLSRYEGHSDHEYYRYYGHYGYTT